MKGLFQLPAEVLLTIMGRAEARCVESLGATCSLMYAMARDDALWQGLFVHDYGRLYDQGTPAMPWPHGERVDDPWPPESVLRICGLPEDNEWLPRRSDEAWLPRPFARMRAAGKGARWLYAAHASVIVCDDHVLLYRCDMREAMEHPYVSTATICVGGVTSEPNGTVRKHGYCVSIMVRASGGVARWTECDHARDVGPDGWSVETSRTDVTAIGRLERSGLRRAFSEVRGTGSRSWFTVDGDGFRHGHYIEAPTDGSVRERRYVVGKKVWSRFTSGDGSVTDYAYDKNGNIYGEAVTYYANGDRVTHSWLDGNLTGINRFVCSSACGDPEFAGRAIAGEQWLIRYISIAPVTNEYAFWPVGDSESARLFRRYVDSGLIGWSVPARDAVIDAIRALPR